MVPLNIPELVSREIVLILVRLPGGTAIIFAQSWNFKLKFFLGIPFMKKIGSMGSWVHFLPKNESKWSKNHNRNFASILQKTWKWTKFSSHKVFKYNQSNFLLIPWIFKQFLAFVLGIHKIFKFGFLAVLNTFLIKNWIFTPLKTIFYIQLMSLKNFSLKFQLWAKTIAAPPRAIHIKKFRTCGHVQNLLKGQKTSLVLPGNAFDS